MDDTQCPTCGETMVSLFGNISCPRCIMQMLSTKKELPKGDGTEPSVPGLVVHEEIGEGGFGIIYRATQTAVIQREVALKILKPGLDTRAIMRRFAVERQALAALEHQHIARFYDAGQTPSGHPWFTMEYIAGEPITTALAGKDWRIIITAFLQACQAVSFAHEKGIIHRDLKPSNILMTRHGQVKVIDFGVAKAVHPEPIPGMTVYTADEIEIGTPHYRAPETGTGADERSDVFSLGRTLFTLLTGLEIAEDEKLPSPSAISTTPLTPEIDKVIAKACAHDPEKRYAQVEDFERDLQRLLLDEPVLAPTPHRRWIPWTFATALLIGLGIWFLQKDRVEVSESALLPAPVTLTSSGHPTWFVIHPSGERALAIFRVNGRAILFDPRDGREIASISGQPEGIGNGHFSEDGKRFFIGLSDGHYRWFSTEDGSVLSPKIDCTPRDSAWIGNIMDKTLEEEDQPTLLISCTDGYLRAYTHQGKMRWETKLVLPPYCMAVSPKGDRVIIGARDGRLNFIDTYTSNKQVLHGHQAHIYDIAYAPDGSKFACASYDGNAGLWSAEGKLLWMGKHDGKCREVDFSPDGTLLASASFDSTARLWNVASGEQLHCFHHNAECYTTAFSPDGRWLATGGTDEQLRIWDVASGKQLGKSYDCQGGIDELEFSFRKDGTLNIIAQTWTAKIIVIPIGQFEIEP